MDTNFFTKKTEKKEKKAIKRKKAALRSSVRHYNYKYMSSIDLTIKRLIKALRLSYILNT